MPEYFLALTTGLFGGFGHCVGMCGPVVAAYSLKGHSAVPTGPSVWRAQLLYNAGRIFTYTLVGAAMGLTGSFVNIAGSLAGFQDLVAVAAGIVMIAFGLSIAGIWSGTAWIEGRNNAVLRLAHRVSISNARTRAYALGMVLGFLPCGLSYTIFIAAAGTGSVAAGMLTALAFGIGTLPALLSFGMIVTALSARMRGLIYRSGGGAVIVMGVVFILRGLRHYAHL